MHVKVLTYFLHLFAVEIYNYFIIRLVSVEISCLIQIKAAFQELKAPTLFKVTLLSIFNSTEESSCEY